MKRLVSLISVALFGFATQAGALTITDVSSAQELADEIVGTGITISNVSYTGALGASSLFTDGLSSGFGIESGILLTSGDATLAEGDNVNNSFDENSTGANSLPGSAMLDALIPGYDTFDATVLSFDFTTTGAAGTTFDLYFNYVFASEEYNEYVDSPYNDVFGFFLDGTDVTDNVALIPGTTTAVSINNVNNGLNSEYYNDNDPSDLGSPSPFAFEYDGFTDVFTVEVTGLTVGETHTIALAIADAGDYILDSGVFIQGDSFSILPPDGNPVPEPATIILMGSGLMGLAGVRRRKKSV